MLALPSSGNSSNHNSSKARSPPARPIRSPRGSWQAQLDALAAQYAPPALKGYYLGILPVERLRRARRLVRCSSSGEANIFVPIFPLLIITSTPVGTAALIGTFWFLSAWSSYFDLSEREHRPYLGSENDDEEGRVSL